MENKDTEVNENEAELLKAMKSGNGSKKRMICQILCAAGGLLAGAVVGLLTDNLGWFLPIGLLVGVCVGGAVAPKND